MSEWTTVPCLLALRDEFNAVSPARDKGADGTIGDSAHTSSSDHTPDEDSDALRDHDADSKNEVHALDIDSSGPWPEEGWFNREILALVERERAEYESPTTIGRLQYVIWNRRIASRSAHWTWKTYSGADPHTNHAHFSARYVTSAEADTRPWGVFTEKDEDMTFEADQVPVTYPAKSPTNPAWTGPNALGSARDLAHETRDIARNVRGDLSSLKMQITTLGSSLLAAINALAAKDTVDETALARELSTGVAAAVVARLPADRDDVSQEEIRAAVEAAFRGAFSGKA
jgi:hypothetical protein